MKRLHVNLSVESLSRSVDFYSTLFDQPPTVLKTDYARWMLDDPRVDFAISTRSASKGLDHLGIQVEEPTDLEQATRRLRAAQAPVMEQGATVCCYAQSEKTWSFDPEGIPWETFMTTGDSPIYGLDTAETAAAGVCCTPDRNSPKSACC